MCARARQGKGVNLLIFFEKQFFFIFVKQKNSRGRLVEDGEGCLGRAFFFFLKNKKKIRGKLVEGGCSGRGKGGKFIIYLFLENKKKSLEVGWWKAGRRGAPKGGKKFI